MLNVSAILLQRGGNEGPNLLVNLIGLVIAIVYIVAGWRMFTKAGRPGWGILIPIYNTYLMCKMAGRSGWWVIALLIPLLNIVAWFLISMDLGKAFGKSGVWSFFLLFLFHPIGVLILGFGDDRYLGPDSPRLAYAT